MPEFSRRALGTATALAAAGILTQPAHSAPAAPTGHPRRSPAMSRPAAAPGTAPSRPAFPTLRHGTPADAGLDAAALRRVDQAITTALSPEPDGTFPGAVVLVARHGVLAKHTAYGNAQTYADNRRLPAPRPMRPDTIFDLASVTKVTATTPTIMRLVDAGRIGLDDPAHRWLGGEFARGEKRAITIRRMLTHTSGLWEWQPTYLHATHRAAAIRYISGLPLRYPVGQGRHYSDLNFMLLGEIVRRETGLAIDAAAHHAVHAPLGMTETLFRAGRRFPRHRFAAGEPGNPYERTMISTGEPYPILGGATVDDFHGWRTHTLAGEVDDGNSAYAFGGVAGHAGLFSTVADLAVYCQTLANGGGYGHRRLFSAGTVAEFTRDQYDAGQGLGFWTHRFDGVPSLGGGGFGHSGFTGTEFTVDPARGLIVIMLTNRNHPTVPFASVSTVWRNVCDAVGQSLI